VWVKLPAVFLRCREELRARLKLGRSRTRDRPAEGARTSM
jgi:hypothetical protein